MEPNQSERGSQLSADFENRMRALAPSSASEALKQRLEQNLAKQTQPTAGKPWLIVGAIAAVITITCVLFAVNQNGNELPPLTHQSVDLIGQQQLILESSNPVFVDIPDAAPMWQIDMKLLNREFVETPQGILTTQFEPENRTVFVPVVYH